MKSTRWLSRVMALALLAPIGVHATTTADAIATIERNAKAAHSDAVLVRHNGATLLQQTPSSGEAPVHLMSATKSVVALALVLLLDEGKLASLDEPVSTFYPEWKQGRKKDITVRMLLEHTSGLQNVANAGEELEGAPDLVKLALAAELSSDPGSAFSYNNKATNLLPGIVEHLAGQPIDSYLDTRLFKPLGITHYSWMKDQAGTPLGMAGLSLTARDLVAIGQLLLDRGLAPSGKRVLSEHAVALLTRESARSPDVGLLWWRIPASERYQLKAQMSEFLARRGVGGQVQEALLATAGRSFDSRTALVAFLAERLGADWSQQYGVEITGRGLRLSDLFDVERGPIVAFAANGYLGQHLVIVPQQRLVAVRLIHRRDSHRSPSDDYAAFPADVLQLASTLR
ncbi:serine hydrolase domain-containing protein [uncultured Stenotrophomonas sp.]|uniref:serine hydrolase domain-containing protein n=1 Tax=uncultured Stenotrophomonas sp. TaxID=165438 RepID=UPI0025E58129|nr:serine hydrolase domain-containing protein [uncultured Stenotrophomonas sp.]